MKRKNRYKVESYVSKADRLALGRLAAVSGVSVTHLATCAMQLLARQGRAGRVFFDGRLVEFPFFVSICREWQADMDGGSQGVGLVAELDLKSSGVRFCRPSVAGSVSQPGVKSDDKPSVTVNATRRKKSLK